MRSDEYLENVVKDAFKRELEVDENVARTLPFFAATLGLVATLYGYTAAQLATLDWDLFSLALYALLGGGSICLAGVTYALFQAVRVREYRIPPKETEQVAWARQLETFYEGQGLTADALQDRVVTDVRARMIIEYAEGAEHNRTANAPKLEARALGFSLLVVSLGIAFVMVAIMFAADRLGFTDHRGGSHEPTSQQTSGATVSAAGQPAASASKAASASGGCEVSGRAGRQHGEQMSSTPNTGAGGAAGPQGQAPQSPPQSAPPAAPVHQILKKTEEGGPLSKR